MSEELRQLVKKGREQGFLTVSEIKEALPPDIIFEDQIQEILTLISDLGMDVRDE